MWVMMPGCDINLDRVELIEATEDDCISFYYPSGMTTASFKDNEEMKKAYGSIEDMLARRFGDKPINYVCLPDATVLDAKSDGSDPSFDGEPSFNDDED